MKKIIVSDVTLRVAKEQEIELSFREKLAISKSLEKAGLDSIELAPIDCPKEDSIISRTIAEGVANTISIPLSLDGEDISCVSQCLKGATSSRVQVVVPISTAQMEYIYHLKAPKMLDRVVGLISSIPTGIEIELVARDATRAEEDFLVQLSAKAYESGASIITLCDDAGVYFPDEFASLVGKVKSASDIKVFVEPSNALCLASATAIEVIKAGADGIKTSIIGEYLSPEILSDVIRVKGDEIGVVAGLDKTCIHKVVSDVIETFGTADDTDVSISKDGVEFGTDATISDISKEVEALGYELGVEDVGKVYEEFRRVVDKKARVSVRELEAIVASTAMQVPSTYHLTSYVVNSGNIITATANVMLTKDGETLTGVSTGDGPIDAAFHAIEQIIGHHYELDDFNVQAVTKGREAVGSAVIRLRADGKLYAGNGVSTDIVGACIRAYVNAINKIIYENN